MTDHSQARLNFEHRNDAFHHRRPLNYEQILAKCALIPVSNTYEGTPVKYLLAQGARLLKNEPEELYNYYLLEIKPLVPDDPIPVVRMVAPPKPLTLIQQIIHYIKSLWTIKKPLT